jgi:hypothetical protein
LVLTGATLPSRSETAKKRFVPQRLQEIDQEPLDQQGRPRPIEFEPHDVQPTSTVETRDAQRVPSVAAEALLKLHRRTGVQREAAHLDKGMPVGRHVQPEKEIHPGELRRVRPPQRLAVPMKEQVERSELHRQLINKLFCHLHGKRGPNARAARLFPSSREISFGHAPVLRRSRGPNPSAPKGGEMTLADEDPPFAEQSGGAADTILALMSETRRPWTTDELVRALPEQRVLDVLLAVNQLHHAGHLERVAPATYQLPTLPPEQTKKINEQRLWGS